MEDNQNKKKGGFWEDGLSIKETRFSTLIVLTIIGFIYSLVSHYTTGDITNNLLELVKILILSVVGVNVANFAKEGFQSKRYNKETPNYNEGAGNEYYDPEQKY